MYKYRFVQVWIYLTLTRRLLPPSSPRPAAWGIDCLWVALATHAASWFAVVPIGTWSPDPCWGFRPRKSVVLLRQSTNQPQAAACRFRNEFRWPHATDQGLCLGLADPMCRFERHTDSFEPPASSRRHTPSGSVGGLPENGTSRTQLEGRMSKTTTRCRDMSIPTREGWLGR